MKEASLNPMNLSLSYYAGSIIRKERIKRGLSGDELAKLVHLSQQQISRYECGKTGLQLESLFKLLWALRMDESAIESFFHQVTTEACGMPYKVVHSKNMNK